MAASSIELTILIPCLNEAETLGDCIAKARLGIERSGVQAEIVVADNGSSDASVNIAKDLGVRVVHVAERGYGNALRGGIQTAFGKWILMGDADSSYDFSEADRFVRKLKEGFDLVIGCRLPSGGGRIVRGAMPWQNRWLGNPVLSLLARVFFKCPVHDVNCGLRAFTKVAFQKMELKTTGMEFAPEMVFKSTLEQLKIIEVPITLYRDNRSRRPHLRPWRDGWRTIQFMLIYSPRWLFFTPGLVLSLIGIALSVALSFNDIRFGEAVLSVGTLSIASMMVVFGFQLIVAGVSTKVFAIAEGLLPPDRRFTCLLKVFTLDRGIIAGAIIVLAGVILLSRALWIWQQTGYGQLSYPENLRRLVPAALLIIVGSQSIFSSFFLGVLQLKTVSRTSSALTDSEEERRNNESD